MLVVAEAWRLQLGLQKQLHEHLMVLLSDAFSSNKNITRQLDKNCLIYLNKVLMSCSVQLHEYILSR